MNTETYRLTRGKLHRIDSSAPTGYRTFKTGDVFVPSDTELAAYRQNFDGPIAAANAVVIPLASDTPLLRATRDLAMGLPGIRDAVRQSDAAYLELLREQEAARKPAPRVKVMQMIERRLRAMTTAA